MTKKILCIEDDEVMINLISRKLSQEGYEVHIARDGVEGLEMIKTVKPDLILLDIVMPRMDGMEVMEKINEDEEMKKIPIVIISNSGQPVEIKRIKELGAKDWLIKTEFDPKEVIEKVVKHIK
ncbi:MAG: response regulator [Patescibacteria group bacterium]